MQKIRPAVTAESVSTRLKWTRQALGYSQADWSRFIGIAPQAWNNYERGLRRISINQSLKLCDRSEVSLDWIYRGVTAGLPRSFAEKMRRMRTRVA